MFNIPTIRVNDGQQIDVQTNSIPHLSCPRVADFLAYTDRNVLPHKCKSNDVRSGDRLGTAQSMDVLTNFQVSKRRENPPYCCVIWRCSIFLKVTLLFVMHFMNLQHNFLLQHL